MSRVWGEKGMKDGEEAHAMGGTLVPRHTVVVVVPGAEPLRARCRAEHSPAEKAMKASRFLNSPFSSKK